MSITVSMWAGQDDPEEESRRLPDGWDCVSVPPPAKSYLLSPGVDSEGRTRKRIRVFDPNQLGILQRPSPDHPRGRFLELNRSHFPWVKQKLLPKRVQVRLKPIKKFHNSPFPYLNNDKTLNFKDGDTVQSSSSKKKRSDSILVHCHSAVYGYQDSREKSRIGRH